MRGKWWWPFGKRDPRKEGLKFQSKIERIPTIYANNFNNIGIFKHLGIGGVKMTPQGPQFEIPKIVYAWLDPSSGMDKNKAWILCCVEGRFIELKVTENIGEVQPIFDKSGKMYSFPELLERVEHGDFDEMFNEDTDKTVNQELKELITKNKLK